jgi:hypothetical protein
MNDVCCGTKRFWVKMPVSLIRGMIYPVEGVGPQLSKGHRDRSANVLVQRVSQDALLGNI